MPDRLSVLNDALRATGNNLVEEEGEDTDEYNTSSAAYDRELPLLLERHAWNFAVATEALEAVADQDEDNPSQLYDYAYHRPGSCLWLQSVWQNGNPVVYEIIGALICTDFLATDASPLTAKFTAEPDRTAMSNLFFEVLRLKVEVGLLRAYEDYAEAERRDQRAEFMLANARTRSDQQTPRRSIFSSRMLRRRRGLV